MKCYFCDNTQMSIFVDPIGQFSMCIACAERMLYTEYIREVDDLPTLAYRINKAFSADSTLLREVAAYLAARGHINVDDLI